MTLEKNGRRLAYSTLPKKLEAAHDTNNRLLEKIRIKDKIIADQAKLISEMKGRIPKSKLHHVLVAAVLMLKEMKPTEDYTITLGKADMIGMLMFFFFSNEEYISESDWNKYVLDNHVPVRFKFQKTISKLIKLGLIDFIPYTKENGKKDNRYFLIYDGREMAQQINWLRQQLNVIGYKPSGVDGK